MVPVSELESLDLSSDGLRLVTGGTDGVRLYNTTPSVKLSEFVPLDGIIYVEFSNDHQQVGIVEENGQVFLLDAQTGDITEALSNTGRIEPSTLSFAPDDVLLAIGMFQGAVTVWNLPESRSYSQWRGNGKPLQVGETGSTYVEWTADAKYLVVSGAWSPDVQLWDAGTGKQVRQFSIETPYDYTVVTLALSSDDQDLAASYPDNNLAIWDLSTGTLINQWQVPVDPRAPNLGTYSALIWSQDGALLAAGSNRGVVMIIDAADYSSVARIDPFESHETHRSSIADLRWSPDGSRLYIATTGGDIFVWDMDKNELIETIH
jgi:WD40 repeat protein